MQMIGHHTIGVDRHSAILGYAKQMRHQLLGIAGPGENPPAPGGANRDEIPFTADVLRSVQTNVFVLEFHAEKTGARHEGGRYITGAYAPRRAVALHSAAHGSIAPLRTLRFQARVIAGSTPKFVWHFQVGLPDPTALHFNVVGRSIRVGIVTDALQLALVPSPE